MALSVGAHDRCAACGRRADRGGQRQPPLPRHRPLCLGARGGRLEGNRTVTGLPFDVVGWLHVAVVLAGTLPQIGAAYQYLIIAGHFRRNHYSQCRPWFPRTAILIAAWNEGQVIGTTVDRLMRLEYPKE